MAVHTFASEAAACGLLWVAAAFVLLAILERVTR